jgi:diguanylate cyclase (GGDEF)-like protein
MLTHLIGSGGNFKRFSYERIANRDLFSRKEIVNTLIENVINFVYYPIDKLARHDCMTGLLNSTHIRKKAAEAVAIANRRKISTHVLIIDIDHFKMINDIHGHSAGDAVIKSFAQIIATGCRLGEYAGRLGGDEFLLVLANSTRYEARAVAHRILLEVRDTRLLRSNKTISFSVSIGIAGYPDHAESDQDLIESADRALYLAKERGRDQYAVCLGKEALDSGS